MAGGTPAHARICGNLITGLNVAIGARPCTVFTTDLRIRVLATGLATYPDVSVICGAIELDPADRKGHTALNPTLLVEVLSPSTEDYDRGEKLASYQQIPSVTEIVLVAHAERKVTVWRRAGATFASTEYTEGVVPLGLGCELALDAIYRDPLGG
jgi:Uma2 family endonuclease